MNPAFKVTPEAKKFVARLERAERDYDRQVDKVLKEVVQEIAAEVKSSIENQTLGFVHLAPGYAARKSSRALDPRILIATKEYLRKIEAKRIMMGTWGITGDFEMAKRFELGTKTMKPRPHWMPALQKVFGRHGMSAQELLHAVLGD